MSIYKDKVLLITGGTDDAEHSLRLREVGKIVYTFNIDIAR